MEPLILSHSSALRAIRAARRKYADLPWTPLDASEQQRVLQACKPKQGDIDIDLMERHGFWEGVPTERLHFLVSEPSHRGRHSALSCHVCSKSLPEASILHVEGNIYCCSPALCALQCSKELSAPMVMVLLMELLGTYTLPEEDTLPIIWGGYPFEAHGPEGHLEASYRCQPVLTMEQLGKMVSWASGRAYRPFRQMASLAIPNAASPAESIMCGMFAPPFCLGGFNFSGLPGGIVLNHRIDFSHDAVLMASGIPYAIVDAYVPSAGTAFEYNGSYHELANSRVHDGQRNNGLKGMGIKAIVINRDQIRDIEALEAIARSVYRDAGVRFRYRINGYRNRQAHLLNELRRGCGLKPV